MPQLVERDAFDTAAPETLTLGVSLGEWPSQPASSVALDEFVSSLGGEIEREVSEFASAEWGAADFRITLRAQMGRGTLTLHHNVMDKEASLPDVPPLTFDVLISPPVTSSLAQVRMSLDLSEGFAPTYDVKNFPRKLRFIGDAVTSDGRAVGGARVVVRRLAPLDRYTDGSTCSWGRTGGLL